jgi:hypothetical protein
MPLWVFHLKDSKKKGNERSPHRTSSLYIVSSGRPSAVAYAHKLFFGSSFSVQIPRNKKIIINDQQEPHQKRLLNAPLRLSLYCRMIVSILRRDDSIRLINHELNWSSADELLMPSPETAVALHSKVPNNCRVSFLFEIFLFFVNVVVVALIRDD